jgi:hypothetical protein
MDLGINWDPLAPLRRMSLVQLDEFLAHFNEIPPVTGCLVAGAVVAAGFRW